MLAPRERLTYARRMAYPQSYPGIKQGVRLLADAGRGVVQLTAVVDRVDDQGRLELGCLDAARSAELRTDLAVTLEYFREGAVYKMQTVILEADPAPSGSDPKVRRRVVVAPPRDTKKIQRRRFTRAIVSVFVRFIKVNPEPDFALETRKGKKQLAAWAHEAETKGHQAFTETLSGSGLRMRSDVPLGKGDRLFLQIELATETIGVIGEVVWLGSRPPQEVPGEAVGVDFQLLSDEARQLILEFVEGQKRR